MKSRHRASAWSLAALWLSCAAPWSYAGVTIVVAHFDLDASSYILEQNPLLTSTRQEATHEDIHDSFAGAVSSDLSRIRASIINNTQIQGRASPTQIHFQAWGSNTVSVLDQTVRADAINTMSHDAILIISNPTFYTMSGQVTGQDNNQAIEDWDVWITFAGHEYQFATNISSSGSSNEFFIQHSGVLPAGEYNFGFQAQVSATLTQITSVTASLASDLTLCFSQSEIGDLTFSNGWLDLPISDLPTGATVTVERATSLMPADWNAVTSFIGTATATHWQSPMGNEYTNEYYRVTLH